MKNIAAKLLALALPLAASSFGASAQEARSTIGGGSTNIQLFYDFGADRQIVTATLEGFYNDPWGNTFFFIDTDFGTSVKAPLGAYCEIARCFNFWKDTPLGFLSLQAEYNGGRYSDYGINHAFLAGADFFVHSADYRNCFNFKLLYKHILYSTPVSGTVPLQFTFVWGMKNLFGVKGLAFSGFADFWGERHSLFTGTDGQPLPAPEESSFVFLSEPQLWYGVGSLFGCDNLNIGGEVELSWDFGACKGFRCRPCAGIKWIF